MRYTKPTILNESKATPVIMSNRQFKHDILPDANPTPVTPKTAPSAYEADE
jgi:hypothetical protein